MRTPFLFGILIWGLECLAGDGFTTNNGRCVSAFFQSRLSAADPYKWLSGEDSITGRVKIDGAEKDVVINPKGTTIIDGDVCTVERQQKFEDLVAGWVKLSGAEFSKDGSKKNRIIAVCSKAESTKIRESVKAYLSSGESASSETGSNK